MTHINQRRDTAANWTAANPVLMEGEVGWETDTLKAKLGDGVATWTALSYAVQPVPDLSLYALLASPAFTGNPTAPTPVVGDDDTSIATTGFVKDQDYAPLASPVFTGNPTAPTPLTADNDTSIATTAFVKAQGYLTAVPAGYAPLADPAFTGNPTAPTPTAGDADTSIATTAFVDTSFAKKASPALTGTPTAPTASVSTDSTQLATTAYVKDAIQGSSINLGSLSGAVNLGSMITASTAVNGVATGSMAANVTFDASTMPVVAAGTQFVMRLTQDATGGRTLTLTNIRKPGGTLTLSTAAAAVDLVVFFYDGASWYASLSGKGFAV